MRATMSLLFLIFVACIWLGAAFSSFGLVAPSLLPNIQTSMKKISVVIPGEGDFKWINHAEPPILEAPLQVEINENTTLSKMGDFDRVGCEGFVYHIRIPDGIDALITADANFGILKYPVWVTGGRNVHILGLELRPIVQPGCGVGEATQVNDSRPNIHPRMVGSKAFRVQQTELTYIEGVDIDLNGMEADCFAIRNPDFMGPVVGFELRHIVIINTRCTGIEGLDNSPIGDGIHGDFFQNQGKDDIASLILENVTILSSSNGITLHNWHKSVGQPRWFQLNRVNFGWDSRFADDDNFEISGLAFTASASESKLENVWIDHGDGFAYGILNGQRIGAYEEGDYVKFHPGIFSGIPSQGDFAEAAETGVEYRSPF